MELIIRHLGQQNGTSHFRVENRGNGKTGDAVELVAPDQLHVEGRPNGNLLNDLRWYLEEFLGYPFSPNTEVAARVQETLKGWGEQTFTRLFSGRARDWYQEARHSPNGIADLTIKIASDDPRILAWPWEALRDPEASTLAHACCLERQLNELHDPLPLSERLPRDRINILLVVARPKGEEDVGYHALARPLVELAKREEPPVDIDLLRPPTFAALRQKLRDTPDHYHIVHFDGHGGYGQAGHAGTPYTLEGPCGRILFETTEGQEDAISAEQLTQLLGEHRIPVMVLNACQSARIDARADDPFASVAAALIKAGIRSVVAMGYNLYVTGGQRFVPAFYQRLFASGSVSEAARAGRQAMRERPRRACLLGEFDLQDWLVPVVYAQEPLALTFGTPGASPRVTVDLPPEALEVGDYGFIGRDRAVLALERALRLQPQAGLLIHGMAGIGKTTLVQGFLQWLRDTNGLAHPPLWFRFDDIRSAEFVINTLVAALLGSNALAAAMEQKIDALAQVLAGQPLLLVWDNFESAAGIPGTEVVPLLPDADRELLLRLLARVRGGKSKVLITSRSPESWLPLTACFRLPLAGLRGEECWQYCNAVVGDLGLRVDRSQPEYAALMERLAGHPLAMRAVLLRLSDSTAAQLLAELEQGFIGAEGDESTRRIDAALALLAAAFPASFTQPLQFIGLHQRYVDIDYVADMGHSSGLEMAREELETVFAALERAGQLHHLGHGIHAMHPALGGFLQRSYPAPEAVQRGFVDVLGRVANQLTPKELHEQRTPFALHGANFHGALALANVLAMPQHTMALVQSLAAYRLKRRDYASARRLFEDLATDSVAHGNHEGEASAYHQLGMIAQKQRQFQSADGWYLKSLAIVENLGNEHDAARTYHQLGRVAQEQRQFQTSEGWYLKSLAIKEKLGDEHNAASTYHQLGRIAQEQRDFQAAEESYQKALAIFEKLGIEHHAASTYHQLGRIAEEQRDFQAAEGWSQKALAIFEKQGNEHGAASTYHQLGRIAEEQQDFQAAEGWYLTALAIFEKQGNEHGAASTYHQLGTLSMGQEEYEAAGRWLIKAASGFVAAMDPHLTETAAHNFTLLLRLTPAELRQELLALWNQQQGLPAMPTIEEIEEMPNGQ